MTMNQTPAETPLYYRYWGKAKPNTDNEKPAYHLLPYHCLDVAAVGCVLLERHTFLSGAFERLFGLPKAVFMPWLKVVLAFHDCGKFAESFQHLKPELRRQWWGEASKTNYGLRHDSLGYVLWEDESAIRRRLQIDMRFYRNSLRIWMQATTGHHGWPPKNKDAGKIMAKTYFKDADIDSSAEFFREVCRLFKPDTEAIQSAMAQEDWLERLEQASWLLAGFAILCDWLGSDADIFSYRADESITLDDYWEQYAKPSAERAVTKSGIVPAQAGEADTLHGLFGLQTPTPLQREAEQLPLIQCPQLLILEDVTGAGKTEAALMITHRLISEQSLAQGLFIGLPTMATANAMYERAADCYRKFYRADQNPSLVLAHSARHLSDKFRQSLFNWQAKDTEYGRHEATASVQCSRWLSDHRKKALLADVGIGTIDQVLLGILPARHQSLRLLGLVNKVLIVDEVHAYDAYMNRLLQTLLEFHAFLGGSAILLSATLPFRMRENFIRAFRHGAGYANTALQKRSFADYPLLTHIGDAKTVETVLATRPEVARQVAVDFLHDTDTVIETIKTAVAEKCCVCWIRNTVFDARTAYRELQQIDGLNQEHLFLFHSRYTLHDRKTLEDDILKRFDKRSTGAMRQGRVVIATQVVEQSLDLDFDLIVSDLAPIDLLIQRAGRLRRHCRDTEGNPQDGFDQRPGLPTLFVHSPPLTDAPTENWYKALFPKADNVYPHTGQLWRTARLLAQKQGWRMPEDARKMIETVYSDDDADLPQALKKPSNFVEGDQRAKMGLAKLNELKLMSGYSLSNNPWDEEAHIPTRLSEDSVTLHLAVWRQDELTPLVVADSYAWDLSSLHVPAYRVKTIPESLLPAVNVLKDNDKCIDSYAFVLPLAEQSGARWQGQIVDTEDKLVDVVYCQRMGLLIGNDIRLFIGDE